MIVCNRQRFALAATGFVGTPFKLHGRDPLIGLDCIGLVSASLLAIGKPAFAPRNYALRNVTIGPFLEHARLSGFIGADDNIRSGDVLLVRPGPAQHHVMIATDSDHVVHAHAGLRRVVLQPLGAGVEILKHWRLKAAD